MSLIYQDREIASTGINDSLKSKTSTYSSQKIEELTARAVGGVTYYIKGSEESESGYTNLLDADDNEVHWNQYLATRDACSVMLLDDFYVNIPTFEGLRLTPTNIYNDEFSAVISVENTSLEDKSPRLINVILYTPDDWNNDPIEVGITKETLGGGGASDDKLKELISTNLDRGYLGGGIIHPNLYEYDDEYLYRDVKFSYHYGQLELSSEKTSTTQSINTYIYKSIKLQAGVEYRFMGCAEGGSDSTYMLRLTDASINHDITDYQGTTFTASGGTVNISIIIKTGVDVNGLMFMPQIVEEKYYFEGASFPQSWSNSVLTETVRQLQNPRFLFVEGDPAIGLEITYNGYKMPYDDFLNNKCELYAYDIGLDGGSIGYFTGSKFNQVKDYSGAYEYTYECIAQINADMYHDSRVLNYGDKLYIRITLYKDSDGFLSISQNDIKYNIIKSNEIILANVGSADVGKPTRLRNLLTGNEFTDDLDFDAYDFKILCEGLVSNEYPLSYIRPVYLQHRTYESYDYTFVGYSSLDDSDGFYNDYSMVEVIGIYDPDTSTITYTCKRIEYAPKTFHIKDLSFTSGNVSKTKVAIYSDYSCTNPISWSDFTKGDYAPKDYTGLFKNAFFRSNTRLLMHGTYDGMTIPRNIFDGCTVAYPQTPTGSSGCVYKFEKVSNASNVGASGSDFKAGYISIVVYEDSSTHNAVFNATFTELQQVHKELQLEMKADGNHIYRYVNGQKTADFKKFSTFMMNSEYDILCIRYPYHFGKLTGGYNNDYNYFVFSGTLKNASDDKLCAVMVTFSDDGSDGIVTNFEAKALV